MNSLVVFLSVVALVAGKPSGLHDGGIIAYSSPILTAAPAAVSHQSRLDIKSSPALVATAAVEPIARTVIAEPTVYAAPAIAAVAPAAVSSQSRIDIKTTPAITSTVVSAPVAYSAHIAPYAYSAPLAYKAPILAAPAILKTAYAAPALIKSEAWAPAIESAAIPEIASPAVPLDTPEVIAARAAHLEAKNLAGAHLIHKRSVAAPLLSTHIATPLISTYAAPYFHSAPLTYSSPLIHSYPLITKAYSVHPW